MVLLDQALERYKMRLMMQLADTAYERGPERQALLEQLRGTPQDDPNLNDAVVKAANDAESKRRQADAVNKLVDAGLAQN